MSRQIVLDTETTGLDTANGHRIIEIGCVELRDRRLTGNHYHQYIQPQREIDAGAFNVHGISNGFLADKPLFGEIYEAFIQFVDGAELIIHNASFDEGFLDHELALAGYGKTLKEHCLVTDSLALARKMYPGQRNSLDALCKRLDIDNGHRTLHGALLDSEILADVYLRMTGGQTALALDAASNAGSADGINSRIVRGDEPLLVVAASASDLEAHGEWMTRLSEAGTNHWERLLSESVDP